MLEYFIGVYNLCKEQRRSIFPLKCVSNRVARHDKWPKKSQMIQLLIYQLADVWMRGRIALRDAHRLLAAARAKGWMGASQQQRRRRWRRQITERERSAKAGRRKREEAAEAHEEHSIALSLQCGTSNQRNSIAAYVPKHASTRCHSSNPSGEDRPSIKVSLRIFSIIHIWSY